MKIFLWLFLSVPATSCLTEGSLLSVATVGFCLTSLPTFVIQYGGKGWHFSWNGLVVLKVFLFLHFSCSKVNAINNIKDSVQCCRKEEWCAAIISRQNELPWTPNTWGFRTNLLVGVLRYMYIDLKLESFWRGMWGSLMPKTDNQKHPQNPRTFCGAKGCDFGLPGLVLCLLLQKQWGNT